MKGSKEFFEELMDGEEYAVVMTRLQTYHQIDDHIKEQSTLTVRVKSCQYDEDEKHCKLVKAISKAKKHLRDYEFQINNGKASK